jgi:hypothetical protein
MTSPKEELESTLIELTVKSAHDNLNSAIADLNNRITETSQLLMALCEERGVLQERLRLADVIIREVPHHHHMFTENPQTTKALKNLHKVHLNEEVRHSHN